MLQLQPCRHDPLCYGNRWRVVDETALARAVAWVLVGQYVHAEAIIRGQPATAPFVVATAKQQVILRLQTKASDALNAHRDGWLFQHISWIAAILDTAEPVVASAPHPRPAEKGFDIVLVPLASATTAKLELIIGEDKATTNPRAMIRDGVWPEIAKLEAGKRDAEVQATLTSLIAGAGLTNKDALSTAAFWQRKKRYRVCVTIPDGSDGDAARRALFDGYDMHAPGPTAERRKAETFALNDLRAWMKAFSLKVVAQVKQL